MTTNSNSQEPSSSLQGQDDKILELLDYFAGKAMQAILIRGIPNSWTDYDVSLNAYRYAKGMIETREAKLKQWGTKKQTDKRDDEGENVHEINKRLLSALEVAEEALKQIESGWHIRESDEQSDIARSALTKIEELKRQIGKEKE